MKFSNIKIVVTEMPIFFDDCPFHGKQNNGYKYCKCDKEICDLDETECRWLTDINRIINK